VGVSNRVGGMAEQLARNTTVKAQTMTIFLIMRVPADKIRGKSVTEQEPYRIKKCKQLIIQLKIFQGRENLFFFHPLVRLIVPSDPAGF
jgi:hypothetical protein